VSPGGDDFAFDRHTCPHKIATWPVADRNRCGEAPRLCCCDAGPFPYTATMPCVVPASTSDSLNEVAQTLGSLHPTSVLLDLHQAKPPEGALWTDCRESPHTIGRERLYLAEGGRLFAAGDSANSQFENYPRTDFSRDANNLASCPVVRSPVQPRVAILAANPPDGTLLTRRRPSLETLTRSTR
jgi:hypothetical protein